MTDKLRKVDNLIKTELDEANTIHPPFVDMHHAYAVMKEELEETKAELDSCYNILNFYWESVKCDDFITAKGYASQLLTVATRGVIEMVQLAAMAQKATEVECG